MYFPSLPQQVVMYSLPVTHQVVMYLLLPVSSGGASMVSGRDAFLYQVMMYVPLKFFYISLAS